MSELNANPTEMDLIDHLAEENKSAIETVIGEETGQAKVAPETEPAKAEASTEAKGQAEKAPEGQAKPAPEGEEKTEPAAEAKQYTPEEIADLEKRAKSYDEAHPALTKAQQEAARLRNELAALKAEKQPQTAEEFINEALSDKEFGKTVADYEADPVKFTLDRQKFIDARAERANTIETAMTERAGAINKAFESIGKTVGDTFKEVQDKVVEYIKERYNPAYLINMPVEEIPDFIERAVKAVDPKVLERADHATEAARIEKIKAAAALSTAQPKGKPGGPADLSPLQKQGEDHMASLNEVLQNEHFIPRTST